MSWSERHGPAARATAALCVAVALAACGFQPVHGRRTAGGEPTVAEAMAQIRVQPIREFSGQVLRSRLQHLLSPYGPTGPARYLLTVELFEAQRAVAVRRDATATRTDLALTARFFLVDSETNQSLFRGQELIASSFNKPPSTSGAYADIAAVDDARDRGLEQLAGQIVRRLQLYIRDPRTVGPAPTPIEDSVAPSVPGGDPVQEQQPIQPGPVIAPPGATPPGTTPPNG
ncbi:MAG: hypothetical protein JNK11_15740 [Alphaproteobacteria bacterium]|nr:hypothetical protein [Alphaproteobacteria bacterium]